MMRLEEGARSQNTPVMRELDSATQKMSRIQNRKS
jgi:hypothetical protein